MEPKITFGSATYRQFLAMAGLMALMGACSPSESSGPAGPGQGSGGSGTGGRTTAPGTGGAPGATGGSGLPVGVAGMNGQTGGSGSTAAQLPCDVAAVVASKCQSCHGKTPLFGAPMPLVTAADFQAAPPKSTAAHVYQAAAMRTHDTANPMPPKGQPMLTNAELSTLDKWFAAGAPAGTGTCTTVPPAGTGGAGGGKGGGDEGIGVEALPCKPNYTFTAHAAGSSTARYPVPNPTNDAYVCFNFKSPIKKGEQAIAFAPIIDDERVIHHWILYGTNTALTDGSITANCSTGSSTFVTGWAPGGQNGVMDPDVGLVLDYQYFMLQVHYNNQQYADGADASGVAFCTTDTPRTHAAGIVTLGSPLINIPPGAKGAATTGVCRNLAADGKTPMTVVSTSPHMHLLGTGFKTTHMRGLTDMGYLTNLPIGTWSFDNQKHYRLNPRREVLPGDVLTTTCYFDNPTNTTVTFGERTRDEMCFDFITVYPYNAATKSCFSPF